MSNHESAELILGTELDDDLIGSGEDEVFWGFGGNDRIYALAGNDELHGGDGNDLLDGGLGLDLMFGGSGDDSYRVDDPGDVVSEQTTPGQDDGGTDTVTSTISYTLGAFVEKLHLSGSAAINGTGNNLDNLMKGNNADNILFGGDGSDTIRGYDGDDVLIGGAGRDYYTGGAGADTFVFQSEQGNWNRVYDFTAAEDKFGIIAREYGLSEGAGLSGGVLADSYFVAGNAATAIDHGQFLFKAAKSELMWDADGVEGANPYRIALITADTAITADKFVAYGETGSLILGTEQNDDLIGSGDDEVFWGFGGNDRIYARAGNDELLGGDGNDLLDGGLGRDLMFGGSGDDKYRVDDPGDVVSEQTTHGHDDGGTDTVTSTISYTLGAFVEKLELSGGAAANGTGNDLNNLLKGNNADNILFGGDGSDTIRGNDGDDDLIGGAGRDYYTGGAGADTFVFQSEQGNWDRVYDFTAEDRFGIIASEYGLSEGAGLSGGVLADSYFVAGDAATASGHGQFLFKAAQSELMWDADGVGGANPFRISLVTTNTAITADKFFAYGETASASVAAFESTARAENDGPIYFALTLSQSLDEDAILTYSTVDGSAYGGQDFTALSSVETLVKAGQTTVYVPVELLDDNIKEGTESFSLTLDSARFAESGQALAIGTGTAQALIADEGASVVAQYSMTSYGMTDPSALAYDSISNTLFMADSEVDESPFFRSENLFALQLDGSLDSKFALPFTAEPTGLAFDASNGNLFITDDDTYMVYVVAADNPTEVLWSFDTISLGGNDPEDIAIDANTGNLFIANGIDRTIIEVDSMGQTQIDSFVLPPEIIDPEALAFDSIENVFYVGGGFSPNIWKLDRDGDILDVITVLEDQRSADLNRAVSVKDIEFAPASDGSGEMHLYVADYGWSHEADGRLFEVDPGDNWMWGV